MRITVQLLSFGFSILLALQARAEPTNTLREKAEQGDIVAQFEMALIFANGEGAPQDDAEAVKWYRRAADQGLAEAQYNLGFMYQNGRGLPKDESRAVMWFRKAADQGLWQAQYDLGVNLSEGRGVPKDEVAAVKWYRMAADQGVADAQCNLGVMYGNGTGVLKDEAEAAKWYRKAAEYGNVRAQFNLGNSFRIGRGVPMNEVEAVKWYRRAADQGLAEAQALLGAMYTIGSGVPKDDAEGYKWILLAGAQGFEAAKNSLEVIERQLTLALRAEGQRLARAFRPRTESPADGFLPSGSGAVGRPSATGSGFFITTDGYLVTNEHVVSEVRSVRVVTSKGTVPARIVKVDRANDLALLKVDGSFIAAPVAPSRGVRLGSTVATVGFPNVGLQGFSPKLAKGEIASLAGAQDDARHFQISVPVQPGNSGGALFDERGNVMGVIVAKLSQEAALATSGTLAENVNYAIKSSYLLSFLESVPEVAAQLKEPKTADRKFEDVVKDAEQAAVLVLVY